MKAKVLLLACMLYSLQSFGQRATAFFNDCIGYWGKFEQAVKYRTMSTSAGSRVWGMEGKNFLMGTETKISIEGDEDDYIDVNNTKYGECSVNLTYLLRKIYSKSDGYSRKYTVKDVILLPNDNILVFLDMFKTKITGSWKMDDAVVTVDGSSYLVEGGYVPIRNESNYGLVLILSCKQKYNLHKAFPVPYYVRIVPSVNSRIYFLTDREETSEYNICGCKKLYCYNFDGKLLWSQANFQDDFTIFGMEEFKNNLYLLGSSKVIDGILKPTYMVVDATNGNNKDYKWSNTQNYFMGPVYGSDTALRDGYGYSFESVSITAKGLKFRPWFYSNDTKKCLKISYLAPLDEDKHYLNENNAYSTKLKSGW